MNILLIDDEPTLLLNILEDYGGYTVESATDGYQGVQRLLDEEQFYDLIILDVNMPVMDGWQTLQAIRQNQRYAGAYVIMLTSESDESSLIKGLRRGADEYLTKPVSPRRLLAHLESTQRRIESIRNGTGQQQLDAGPTLKLLTSRETEVLQCIARGMSNQLISEKLVISETTVKNHLANIYKKLDVSNRNEAAYVAHQLRIYS